MCSSDLPTTEKPQYIKLEFEEKISPEEVNEIQFMTNDPYAPTVVSNGLTKLGDTFVFERTDPDAPGLKVPENPRKATNIYMYQIKKAIKFAYGISLDNTHRITMPDNQKIKLTPFPLKNIDDERTEILKAPSSSAYILDEKRRRQPRIRRKDIHLEKNRNKLHKQKHTQQA